jgi:hypothetical protein
LKVKCINEYNDRLLKKIIKVDQELEVTEERANQLILAKVAVATPTTEKVAKTRKKKEV